MSRSTSVGFIVPFISLYFIWELQSDLRSIAVRPALLSGTLLVAFSSAMLLAGAAASVEALQQVSVLIAIPGMVLLLLGWRLLVALALPVAYLVFMTPPLFDAFIAPLHWPFQLHPLNIPGVTDIDGWRVVASIRDAVTEKQPEVEASSYAQSLDFGTAGGELMVRARQPGDRFVPLGMGVEKKLKDFSKDRKMTWPQFFDGKGWGNKLAGKYGVNSIPATYLMDGGGTNVGKILRGEALNEAVTKALAKK